MKTITTFIFLSIIVQTWAQSNFYSNLADSALTLTRQKVQYDPAYFRIDYPNGDIPTDKGVCTDVIVRAYRKMGIDLQKEVHEDMTHSFNAYPNIWNLTKPDKNIDHRRVPNLMVFFSRKGSSLIISGSSKDYQPGDIVCWDLGRGVTHIGIVSNLKSADHKRPLIIHNIGGGQVTADCLFQFKITGHYKYKN